MKNKRGITTFEFKNNNYANDIRIRRGYWFTTGKRINQIHGQAAPGGKKPLAGK